MKAFAKYVTMTTASPHEAPIRAVSSGRIVVRLDCMVTTIPATIPVVMTGSSVSIAPNRPLSRNAIGNDTTIPKIIPAIIVTTMFHPEGNSHAHATPMSAPTPTLLTMSPKTKYGRVSMRISSAEENAAAGGMDVSR